MVERLKSMHWLLVIVGILTIVIGIGTLNTAFLNVTDVQAWIIGLWFGVGFCVLGAFCAVASLVLKDEKKMNA
jgi:uncharacterized membrane protein HdeD (DUF308 family)